MRIVADLLQRRAVRYTLLGVTTAAGLGLRYYRLGKWGFWRDEMFSVGGQEDGFNYTPLRQSISLYLIRQVVRRWGVDERKARLVPAFFGALSVPLLYPILSRVFSPAVALLASIFLATSPWHLYWSQNARFYTLLLLFYSLALFTFYLGLEEDSPSLLLASLIFLGLATRERLLALLFVPVVVSYLGLLFLLDYPKPRGLHVPNLTLFFLPGVIGALFFARPYLLDLSGWIEGFGRSNNSSLRVVGALSYYVGLPIMLIATAGAIYGLYRKDRALLFTASGAFVPVGILALIAPFHYTASRYGFVTLTSWLALASYGAFALAKHLLQKERRVAAVGLLSLSMAQFLVDDMMYFLSRNGNRDDWKGAFSYLQDHLEADDLVFSTDPELASYYLQRRTRDIEELGDVKLPIAGTRVWIVEDMVAEQQSPKLSEWLVRHARQVATFDVGFWLRTFKMRVYLVD